MISVYEYIINKDYGYKVNEELVNLIAENVLLNENFNAKILKKLARTIYDAEIHNRESDKIRTQNYKQSLQKYKADYKAYEIECAKRKRSQELGKQLSMPTEPRRPTAQRKNSQSFVTLFGPQISTKLGGTPNVIQGIKWDKITDADVQEYNGDDRKLLKILRTAYACKLQALFIICDKNSEDIVGFIKGFGKTYDKSNKPTIYNFGQDYYTSQVKRMTVPKYTWQERNLNVNEVISKIKDYKIYVIEITDDLIKTYKDEIANRFERKQGIINFDKESLEEYRLNQQAKFKVLLKELKDKKLAKRKDNLLNEITDINNKVNNLFKVITSNPEYIDKYYNIGNLMRVVSDAYNSFYSYIKSMRSLDKEKNALKQAGYDDETIDRKYYNSFRLDDAKDDLRNIDSYINYINSEIEKIKNDLKL